MSTTTTTAVSPPPAMPAEDVELLRTAEELLERVWVDGRHEVAAALRLADGSVHTGVHLEGSCRRSSICAEGVAMGAARTSRPTTPLAVTAVVSVQIKPVGRFRIIAPCGVCRELLADYSPEARVWLTRPDDDHVVACPALDLLPEKTRRKW